MIILSILSQAVVNVGCAPSGLSYDGTLSRRETVRLASQPNGFAKLLQAVEIEKLKELFGPPRR